MGRGSAYSLSACVLYKHTDCSQGGRNGARRISIDERLFQFNKVMQDGMKESLMFTLLT